MHCLLLPGSTCRTEADQPNLREHYLHLMLNLAYSQLLCRLAQGSWQPEKGSPEDWAPPDIEAISCPAHSLDCAAMAQASSAPLQTVVQARSNGTSSPASLQAVVWAQLWHKQPLLPCRQWSGRSYGTCSPAPLQPCRQWSRRKYGTCSHQTVVQQGGLHGYQRDLPGRQIGADIEQISS